MCCESCNKSNFSSSGYSNFTDAELRKQCAQELDIDINNASNKEVLDACVKAKKGQQSSNGSEKGDRILGYVTTGGNILTAIANIFGNIRNPQSQPDYGTYNPPQEQPKGLSGLAIAGIAAGVIAIGFAIYFATKKAKGGANG